jgi:hypothetical protein
MDLFPPIPVWPSNVGPLPPPPSRAAVCAIVNSFQGQLIHSTQLGDLYWWDPMLADCNDPADRAQIYPQLRALQTLPDGSTFRNTHINLTLDMTGLACLPKIKALIYEALTVGGFTGCLLCCMGDGDEGNPGALGGQWLMKNFKAIVQFMRDGIDLTPYIVFCPGYDGVIPAWQPPTRVNEFARMARDVLGDKGYLAIEPSGGYWSWSGEVNDWGTEDGQCFDVILQELNIATAPPDPPPAHLLDGHGGWSQETLNQDLNNPWDSVWQIVGHMVKPFNRPAEMPTNDYPDGIPYALGGGTPRGPFTYVLWEHSTYEWVRIHSITEARINDRRACYRKLGCTVVC